jgi:hypothetical protein
VSRADKAVPIWASKIPLCSDQPGHPGRRFGSKHQALPDFEKFTETPRKTKAKSQKRKNFWYTTEGKRMKAFMRSTLNFHPHDTVPVCGKEGCWKPIKTERGLAHVVSNQQDGDCKPKFMTDHDMSPGDTSYGTGMDVESRAQMNERFEKFIGNLS